MSNELTRKLLDLEDRAASLERRVDALEPRVLEIEANQAHVRRALAELQAGLHELKGSVENGDEQSRKVLEEIRLSIVKSGRFMAESAKVHGINLIPADPA